MEYAWTDCDGYIHVYDPTAIPALRETIFDITEDITTTFGSYECWLWSCKCRINSLSITAEFSLTFNFKLNSDILALSWWRML